MTLDPRPDFIALSWLTRAVRAAAGLLLLSGLVASSAQAQVLPQPTEAPCVCTPLLMNTDPTGTHIWWVQARGGNLDISVYGRAVNSVDPSTVTANVFDGGGLNVGTATVSYPAGQLPGTEFSSLLPPLPSAPGAVYRIEVTTPGAPGTQAHFRLAARGANWLATDSPSTPSFEEGHVRWLFAVQAGEPLDVLVSTLGTPASTTTLDYQWIDPSGAAGALSSVTVPDPATPVTLSVASPAAGWWILDVIAEDHYTLDKTSGADRRLYLDWQSAGDADLTGVVTLNGLPNTVPIGIEVRDARTGALVASDPTVTNVIPPIKLISGDYIVHVVVPAGINPVPDFTIHLECDQSLSIVITLTGDKVPPPPQGYPLSVFRNGTGTGVVSSVPAGIFCGSACGANFAGGTVVTLTAVADAGSVFAGWSGACTGTGACTVLMDAAKNVTATFTKDSQPQNYTLTVTRTGSGSVTSAPAGIFCGAGCVATYADGTVVTLTATADVGWTFAGWTGACSGAGSTCTVTMTADRAVTATFTQVPDPVNYTLTVMRTGGGAVTSAPAGIFCGAMCAATYTDGTVVTLTATADPGWTFAGWSGACSGTGSTCTVTIDANKSVGATFTEVTYDLTTSRAGTGSGTVTSSPVAIFCGSVCVATFSEGAVVTLTAVADAGSTFTGWSGTCTGLGTCTVTMDAAKSVTATFTRDPENYTLTVTRIGSGAVTSAPAGIFCGAMCAATYSDGTIVTLTATPDVGWTFAGWSGACSGAGSTCTVTMDANKSVTATFTQIPDPVNYTLTVTRTGGGAVTSAPAGIFCGANCVATYTDGTVVTLTATPDAGWVFAGWSGACSGAGSTCTVTMDANKSVRAAFVRAQTRSYPLTVRTAGTGVGTVTSSPAGIDCGATCAATYTDGTVVTLTATADSGSTFTGWSGECSGTSTTCAVTMDAATRVVATFRKSPAPVPTRMSGQGVVDTNSGRMQFQFAVRERGDGSASIEIGGGRGTKFESTAVTSVAFSNAPSFVPGGRATLDTVVFSGTGRWNGRAGYTFEVRATDQGEPGRSDTFSIVIRDASGAVVTSAGGTLRSGNNQAVLDR